MTGMGGAWFGQMNVQVAIVADDLTGALDVCAPFAARGLRCRVAVTPAGIGAALAGGADVICVNTASREIPPEAAGAIVASVASILAAAAPRIVFKKIDSRLKGNVAEETAACLAAFGRGRAMVAPAIPAQGRFVRSGQVVGMGLATPLDIAAVFRPEIAFDAPDTLTNQDMGRIAGREWSDVLLVGASGLAEGLARILGEPDRHPPIAVAAPLLLAIGSHDPITIEQAARARTLPGTAYLPTADGRIGDSDPAAAVIVAQADSVPGLPGHAAILARFGRSIADRLRQGGINTALISGGETAQTVLAALGIECLDVLGEALPGIAAARAQVAGRALTILTKSGGFGTPDDLLLLAEAAHKTRHPTDTERAGRQA